MYKSKHYNFITTPIFNILEESVIACRGIGDGIETQTISEYILQTTFLKMTGASEQKLKCICWELATNDYEYRYQYLKKDTDYGECSNYKAKNAIYKELIKEIKKQDDSFNFNAIFNCNSKSKILNKVIELYSKYNKYCVKKHCITRSDMIYLNCIIKNNPKIIGSVVYENIG